MRDAAVAALGGHVGQPALRGQFLAAARRGALSRADRPDHLTASALVLDEARTSVLLVLHRKVGLWMQPGGHLEPGDGTLGDAALREAQEETGVDGLRLADGVVDLDRHPAPCGARWHLDVRFLVLAPRPTRPVVSEESDDVRWFRVDALPHDAVPDLARLVAAAGS